MTAACDTNPDLYFSEAAADVEAAKDGCLDCPLSRFNACQAEGWAHEFGVFGGLSGNDRKAADPERYKYLVMGRQLAGARIDKGIIAARQLATMGEDSEQAAPTRARALELLAKGHGMAEVGRLLNVSSSTVRSWVRRAKVS